MSNNNYKKNAAANKDALFGGASGGPKHKREAASNRDALFGGAAGAPSSSSSSSSKPSSTSRPTTATANKAPSNQGYTAAKARPTATTRTRKSALSDEARAKKLKEAEDYKNKAGQCLQRGLFSKPDPVAASIFLKRAADAYAAAGEARLERLYRQQSADTQRMVGAWATAAAEYTRAAELTLEADDYIDATQQRRDAAALHTKAAEAWMEMGEKSKAAASKVQAAIALNAGDESRLLGKEALAGMEEAVEAHVPDVFNVYARYRQTGVSAFIDPDSDETVSKPSAESLAMAKEHVVTRAYAHEPLQELVYLLVDYGEYASALYAAGAASYILEQDGVSSLTLGRAYVAETILTLALGDCVAAEQNFLNRHVQKTAYLSSRECKLAEDLFRAVKMRDAEALEEARSPSASNRAALANLHRSLRELVGYLRLSGVARKTVGDTTGAAPAEKKATKKPSGKKDGSSKGGGKKKKAPPPSKPEPPEKSLEEVVSGKTGYEQEVEEGGEMDGNALMDELDNLDFGLDEEEDLDDDEFDLR